MRLEGQFELGDLLLGVVHLLAPEFAVVAARFVEHLLGGGEVRLGGLQLGPGVVDLGQFLVATREVAQTFEVARDVGFRELGFDRVQFVLKGVQGLVNGAHDG